MTAWRESATISDLIRHGPVRCANVNKKNLVKGVKYRSCLLDKSGAVALPSYRHTPLRFGVVLRFHLAPLALVFNIKRLSEQIGSVLAQVDMHRFAQQPGSAGAPG